MSFVYLFVTGVAAFYCCLGMWVAVSPRHWFLRVSVVLAMLALLVPIRAYEPLALFGLTAAVLAAGVQAVRWGSRRKPRSVTEEDPVLAPSRYRFSLADLCLLLIAAGGMSWLVSVLIAAGIQITWKYLLAAAAFALLTASAVGAVLWPPRWRAFLTLLIAVPGLVALDRFVLGDWLYADELLWIYRDRIFSPRLGLDSLAWLYGDLAGWLLVLTLAAAFLFKRGVRWTTASVALRTIVLLPFLPIGLLAASVYWHMLDSQPPPHTDASRENNLPRVLKIAEGLPNASPRAAEQIYGELLPLLEKPGFSGIDWRLVRQDHGSAGSLSLDSIQAHRELARQLHAAGEQRANMGRPDEAADFALANLRFAAMIDRDGLLIHRLVAEAVFGMGHSSLSRQRDKLSPAKAAEVARVVAAISHAREPIEATIARDELWSDLSQGWRYRLERALTSQVWGLPTIDVTANTYAHLQPRTQTLAELIAVDLALRAYRANHGTWPATLDALTPEYLERVPRDRHSGEAFVYSVSPSDPAKFTLYSVGEGGVDDGGKFTNRQNYWPGRTGYDLDVDTLTRP